MSKWKTVQSKGKAVPAQFSTSSGFTSSNWDLIIMEEVQEKVNSLENNLAEILKAISSLSADVKADRETTRNELESLSKKYNRNEDEMESLVNDFSNVSVIEKEPIRNNRNKLSEGQLSSPRISKSTDWESFLSEFHLWIHLVTDDESKQNAISMFDAFQLFLNANQVSDTMPANFRVFRTTLCDSLSLEEKISSKNRPKYDEKLWRSFEQKYRSILLRPKADSKFILFTKLMDSRRTKRSSVYTAIVSFRREFEKLASLSECNEEEEYVSDKFFFLALLRYLNLTGTQVADFKRRLVNQIEKIESYDDLLNWFSNNNDVEDTIRQEKTDVIKKGFLVEVEDDDNNSSSILDAPSGYCGKDSDRHSKAAFHSNEEDGDLSSDFYKFTKVRWPGSETVSSYNPATFFNTFLGKKNNSKSGLNRFPPGFEKKGKTKSEQKKNLANDMAKALGSNCTRCFRKCCAGSTTGWRDAPCAQEGSKDYVSYEICMTIFHLMKYLAKTNSCEALVTNFYNTKGTSICTEKHMPSYSTLLVKSTSHYFCCRSSQGMSPNAMMYNHDGIETQYVLYGQTSLTSDTSDNELALKYRALRAMPDIGCPELLAGKCWWNDYSGLLKQAGLLENIMTGSVDGTFGFGDGIQKPAMFKALQVPLFYKRRASNLCCILFVNITIVENEVGLLNGKVDLAAFKMKIELNSISGESQFWLMDEDIEIEDEGSHYWFLLECPRPFSKLEFGYSLQKNDGKAFAKRVNAKLHHMKSSAFDNNVSDREIRKYCERWKSPTAFTKSRTFANELCLVADAPLALNDQDVAVPEKSCPQSPITEEPHMGIFEEVFSPEQQDYDSDDNFDFNEELGIYERSSEYGLNNALSNETEDITSQRIVDNELLPIEPKAVLHGVKDGNVDLSNVELSAEETKALVSKVWHLHKSFNHPSTGQLLSVLQNSMPEGVKLPAEVSRAVMSLNCPSCAVAASGNKIPSRPQVSVPQSFAPGELGHLDVGHFDSPSGKFIALIHVDVYSLFVCSASLQDSSAESAVRSFISSVNEHYPTLTADLGSLFDSSTFKSFLSRIGTVFTFVPTGAHWHNRAEKAVHLLKIELQKIYHEFPMLDNESALRLATLFLNKRIMPQYKMSRNEIHSGRLAPKISLSEQLFAQAPEPLPPSLSDVELFMNAADRKRSLKSRKEAQIRISKALKTMRTTESLPVNLRNGDHFLIFHEGVSKSTSGFRGPFICLGQVRNIIVGMSGRRIVTAHPSRVLLHKRSPHDLGISSSPHGILPPTRTKSWESPLNSGHTEEDDRDETVGLPEPSIDDLIASAPMIIPQDGKENIDLDNLDSFKNLEVDAEDGLKSLLQEAPLSTTPMENLETDNQGENLNVDTILEDAPISLEEVETYFETPTPTFEQDSISEPPTPMTSEEVDHTVLIDAPIHRPQDVALPQVTSPVDSSAGSFEEPLFMDTESPTEEIYGIPQRTKRPREDDTVEHVPLQKSRLHCLQQKAKELGTKSRSGLLSLRKASFPNNEIFQLSESDTISSSETSNVVTVYKASHGCIWFENVYMINNSRKRTVVLPYDEAIEIPGMKEAMASEIKNFKDLDVMTEVDFSSLENETNAITTKWVLSVKTNLDGSKKCKARLVARGFEDLEKDNITRDSPTASNATQRLVLQLLVEMQWIPHTWDFRSAFLQGKLLDRIVVLAPPVGFGTPEGKVWVIKKPVYGLVSAPKSWYDALMDVCREQVLDTDVSDEGVLRLLDKNAKVIGILALHVDDAIGGGTTKLFDVMTKVGERLQIGSLESSDTSSGLFYKGLRVSTVWFDKDSTNPMFHVFLDGNDYLDAIDPMPIPEGNDVDALLSKDMFEFRSLAGCIGYMATAFRPDVAIEASMLGRSFLAPTIATAKKANGILLYLKENRFHFTYKPGVKRLTVFADSAGPNEKGTQGGRLYCFTDELSEKICGVGHWESKKITRRCRSTNTGELLSVGAGHDSAVWLRQLWLEMSGNSIDIEIVTDSGGTGTNLATTKLPVERRNRIDMAILRQGLRRGEFAVTWVPSRANLSDVLTKEDEKKGSDQIVVPVLSFKKTLLDALRSGNTNLRGVRKLRRTKEDVSRY